MQRRELFSSLFKQEKKNKQIFIRPPYYSKEDIFLQECITCDKRCVTACDEGIIVIADDKTPHIDFNLGGCTYCDECAIVCPHGVLDLEYKSKINAIVKIDMLKCMSWDSTMCFTCKDPCNDNAIDFLGMFRPSINDNCTSCGFCIGYCPTQAIVYTQQTKE